MCGRSENASILMLFRRTHTPCGWLKITPILMLIWQTHTLWFNNDTCIVYYFHFLYLFSTLRQDVHTPCFLRRSSSIYINIVYSLCRPNVDHNWSLLDIFSQTHTLCGRSKNVPILMLIWQTHTPCGSLEIVPITMLIWQTQTMRFRRLHLHCILLSRVVFIFGQFALSQESIIRC